MSSYSKPHAWVENETVVHASDMDRVEDGLATHTHTSSEVTDLTTSIGAQVDVATINNAFGQRAGQPISPWQPEASIGPELWQVSNFVNGGAGYNISTLTPSLVPNGTGQTSITRALYATTVGGNEAFRLEFDWTTPNNGWGGISVKVVDSGGTILAGTTEQMLVTNGSPGPDAGHYIFDFAPGVTGGDMYIEVKLRLENNANAGSNLAVTNVSLKQITTESQRPLLISKHYNTGTYPYIYVQARDVVTDAWKMCEHSLAPDGALSPYAFADVRGFFDDQPFGTPVPDPAMRRATRANSESIGDQFVPGGTTYTSLRINNNDQIHLVWNGSAYEYRGNTHGGEFTRTSPGASLQIDTGSGWTTYALANLLIPVRRAKVTIPSEFRRSTDGTTPYCTVDRTHTYFPDGMCRTDRTTTFTQSTQIKDVFDWMSSHDTTVPYIGRIGRGLTVINETDSHPVISAPTLTPSTSTTGGTLAAGTYSYRITALTPYGESLPSAAVTQATTGSTSKVTLTWSAVTGATGYRIYGRTAGVEKLLATVTTLTFDDTGANAPIGDIPTVNKARLYNSTTSNTMGQSSAATWAVYRDPRTGWCYGNIYDREAILGRSGVSAAHTRLMRGNGIQKNYANLAWTGGGPITVAPGTVWSATHWSFTYLPANPDDYHNEIAVRAASLTALKSIYPIT